MGYYINQLPNGHILPALGKIPMLEGVGAKVLPGTPVWPPPVGKAYIGIIDNFYFEAAWYPYSKEEFSRWKNRSPDDTRPVTWLIWNEELVKKLSGYKGN